MSARHVAVAATSLVTDGTCVSTATLARRVGRDPDDVLRKTGIHTRWVTDPDVPVAALGARALTDALEAAGLSEPPSVVVLAHSTGGDTLVPATVGDLLLRAGLAGEVHGFDLNDACMGFLKAFDAVASMVHVEGRPGVVVAVETLFRHTHADTPRPHLVFGDAAAAVVVVPSATARVHRAWLRNDPALDGGARLWHGTVDDPRPPFTFLDSNRAMTDLAVSFVTRAAEGACAEAGVALADVTWVLPHQPTGPMRARLLAALGFDDAQTVDVVSDLGSIGAASIPAGLHRLRSQRDVRPGDTVLFVGVGGGGTYGAVVARL